MALGSIPSSVPSLPIERDFETLLKKYRLKRSAEETIVKLDLREQTGRAKSSFFYRLELLQIPWATLSDEDRSTGNFREVWKTRWDPTYAVPLVEASRYGATIYAACRAKVVDSLAKTSGLGSLLALFERALNANLDRATLSEISSAIRRDGALTVDLDDLVDAIPPLVRILRYGNARDVEANDLRFLFDALCARLVASLPYAFVSLNEDASLLKLGKLNALIVALNVLNDKEVLDKFFGAFREVVENPASSKIISGRLVRALFENARCEVEELNRYFSFFVSRRNDAKEVAFWLQGFLSGSGQTILWREEIWKTMNRWLVSVDSDVFQELIPLLRRAFSNFEQNERREMGKIVARLKIVAEETRDDATRPTETNELAREEVANDSGDTGGNVDSDGDGATTTPAQKDDERSDSSDPDAIFDPVLSFILGDDVL